MKPLDMDAIHIVVSSPALRECGEKTKEE